MTKEEIIAMAKQVGMMSEVLQLGRNLELLTAFAKLVAEHEREACAKMAENRVLIEASDIEKIAHYTACKNIASAIRARGQE